MTLVRRILLLAAISVSGVALLAPLAARSAVPTPAALEQHLLAVEAAPRADVDRGTLSIRAASGLPPPSDGAEEVVADPVPTPGEAPMEATIHTIATPPPVVAVAPPRVVTYDGDTVWDDLAKCESGGNWAINTGNGYYGGLQFSYATWHGYDGGDFAEYPHEATRAEQIIVAERLHAARGFQPWPACRIKLGLP
ncbi:MAG TPA: transglycosylase family protein [Patescibacteria group bacterium]|nr:transglycosylase family protein [Patescibacteria group bacterium]